MKYYIGDLHFGHKKVLEFDDRPFKTVEEMNETIIENWNNVVTKNDDVYILGDMFWKNDLAEDIMPRLNGNKYLILGNHDRISVPIKKHLVWIKEIETIRDGDFHVVLCHYPIAHWKNQRYGYIHLYGHIHKGRDYIFFDQYKEWCREKGLPFEAYNVGCMTKLMDYTPRTLEYILTNRVVD